jgi:hypothetical protein
MIGVSSDPFLLLPGGRMRERAETTIEDPNAPLERALLDEFLAARGCSLQTIAQLPPEERHALLIEAARYADAHLAEIDARAAYIHQIRGGSERA